MIWTWTPGDVDCEGLMQPPAIEYVVKAGETIGMGAPPTFLDLATIQAPTTSWADTLPDPPVDTLRVYKVDAIDEAGNRSDDDCP